MRTEGTDAPTVELPAYAHGERRRIDLADYVGEGIVVLAFYPADFNPGCTTEASDLDDLDLFTMQKDVSVLGISPDSTYSHEAFAERYSLHFPLLSDQDGEAIERYDVGMETPTGETIAQRAVFVVDHRGEIQYAWATDDLETLPNVERIKDVVGNIGGDATAMERYRVGFESYADGRDAFREAMATYQDREWMIARTGFSDAEEHFASAADHLDTAVRFAETADFETVVDRVEEKADTLRHAAEWLSESADNFASGSGKAGEQYRSDAQPLLDAAEDLPEPAPPEKFDVTEDGIDLDDSIVVDPEDEEEEGYTWRAGGSSPDASLSVDDSELDAAVENTEAGPGDRTNAETGDTVEGDLEMDVDAVEAADESAETGSPSIEGDTVEGDLGVDIDAVDEEIEREQDADAGREDGGGGMAAPGHEAASDADGTAGQERTAQSTGETPSQSSAQPSSETDPTAGPVGDEQPTAGTTATANGVQSPQSGSGDADSGDPDDRSGGGFDTPLDQSTTDAEDDRGDHDDGEDDGDEGDIEFDLADPTEGEETEDEPDDERTDWDIPGQ